MATPVTMPQMGYDMTEGAVQNWLKKEGDTINKGDILAEIETDKTAIEMEAFASGILKKIIVQPGQTVPVGTVIAVIAEANEEVDYAALGVEAPASSTTAAVASVPAPAPAPAAAPAKPAASPAPATTSAPAKPAAPAPMPSTPRVAAARPSAASLINLSAPIAASSGPGGSAVSSEMIGSTKEPAADEVASPPEVSSMTQATSPTTAPPNNDPSGATAVSGVVIEANGTSGRIKSSPLARKIATDNGLDIAAVGAGTGPGGRIIKADVERYAATAPTTSPQPAPPVAPPAAPPSPATLSPATSTQNGAKSPSVSAADWEEVPVSRMRATIARRLTESKQQIPHFYVSADIDMTAALKLRVQINETLVESGIKVSVNDLIMKASALALRKVPAVNNGWNDGKIRVNHRVNVAMAVALEEGLITPVVFDTDKKSLSQIAVETRALAEKARAGKLTPDEYQGGTFSVSNLGMYEVSSFSAVINPPQAAILAVSSTRPTVVVKSGSEEEGNIVYGVIQQMNLTISADHRVADGAVVARYLTELRKLLQNPLLLMV